MIVAVLAWFAREWRKEVHVTRIWRAVHAAPKYPKVFLRADQLGREIEAIRDLGREAPGTVSVYGAWAFLGYGERLRGYELVTGEKADRADVMRRALGLYRRGLQEAPDNPHFYEYARDFEDPEWVQVFRKGLSRFPDHPYAEMMAWSLAAEAAGVSPAERLGYYAMYNNAVGRRLRESAAFRPGFQPIAVDSSAGIANADGTLVTLLPGEAISTRPFATYGSDRLAVGLYVRVTRGRLSVRLRGHPAARLAEPAVVAAGDPVEYRAWHFTGLDVGPSASATDTAAKKTRLDLEAGPDGARFVVRDLYPIVDNPRWFR